MAAPTTSSGGVLKRVAYTRDPQGSFLLACSGCVVKVFSAATGVQVRLLKGHTAEVTAVAHSPTSVLQGLSAGLDGQVILWDLDEAIALRTICVGLPIISMVLDSVQLATAYILTGAASSAEADASMPAYCRGLAAAGRV